VWASVGVQVTVLVPIGNVAPESVDFGWLGGSYGVSEG
jgi:hypothetical protein